MKVQVSCPKCWNMYMMVMDVLIIENGIVEFLACFPCRTGYTRHDKKIEGIC